MEKRPELISKLAMFLMDKEPLIYLFIINSDFVAEKDFFKKTGGLAAVTFKNKRINFVYDEEIFNKFTTNQIYFIVLHEAMHIFKKHLEIYKDFKCYPKLLNIAMDGVINKEIAETPFNYDLRPEQIKGTVVIPDEYIKENYALGKDAFVTKRLYHWYLKKNEEMMKKMLKEMLKVGSYVKVKGTDKYGRIDSIDKGKYDVDTMSKEEMMDDVTKNKDSKKDHGKHEKHTAEELIPVVFGDSSLHGKGGDKDEGFEDQTIATEPKEGEKEKKNGEGSGEDDSIDIEIFTRKLVQKAKEMEKHISKTAGNEVGGLTRTIEKILEPKVNWKSVLNKHLRLYYSKNASQKESKKSFITYPWNPKSRYGILCKHHIETVSKLQNYVILAMDTSGSVFGSPEEMEVFFSEMEGMAKWFNFTKTGQLLTIMWDTEVAEGLTPYEHKDWLRFSKGKRKVLGGGGTSPQIVFKYFNKIYQKKENCLLVKEKGVNFMIPDAKKPPFLIFLTDGYFFGKLKRKEMGYYKDNVDNVLFFTKSKDCLPKDANYIIYE